MSNFSVVLAPYLLLSIITSSIVSNAYAQEQYLEANLSSLVPTNNCSSSKEPEANSLKISPRYGPCSPLGSGEGDLDARELLRRDRLRVAALHRALNSSPDVHPDPSLQSSLPAHSGAQLNTANYLISISLGTPRRQQTVMFETAATLTWVQCRPCTGFCYPQSDPVFNPSSSSTSHTLSCTSLHCYLLSHRSCGPKDSCLYGVDYGDGSFSDGSLVKDTLALTSSDVFPGFVFGCGRDNQGFSGRAAGIAGLSRAPLSLVSQTSAKFGKVFSYCLPTATSGSVGDLTFGPLPHGTTVYYTPMLTDSRDPSLYFLELTSISVAGRELPVPPAVFRSAGTMIDSGTVVTRLPRTAYAALREAFRSFMGRYKRSKSVGILDTCYDMSGLAGVLVPRVVLSFGGGTWVELGLWNILVMVDRSHVCLAFAGNEDDEQVGIIGNVQQASFRVVYDLGSSRIGFGAGSCR